MSTPQFPTQGPLFPPQLPMVSGLNQNEGIGVNTTVVVFNKRNVNKYVLSNFFKEMTQGGIRQLALDTCAQAAHDHEKFWKKDNLVKDLKAYGLPVDCNHRAQLTDRKTSIVMNVFLKVKEESEKAIDQGGSGDNLEVAKGLCDLLNGTDVRVDGKLHKPYFVDMEFFAGEMNKCQQKLDAARSAIGSLGQERQGVNEPGLPPAENPAFTMEEKPLLPSGNAPTMTPSAPPNYDVVQAEKRLAELNTQIAFLQQGVTQDFQSQPFQHQLSLVQMEIVRLGFNLPVNLQEQYIQAKANLDGLQQQQLAFQEGGRVIEFHGQIDGLKQTLAQNEPKIDNKSEIKALERKVKALDDQIGKLSSPESGPHKEELKERLSELNISISQWFTVVTAFEILAGLKSDLKGFQYQQLPEEVGSFSAKRDAFDAIVRKIPSGELRNQLIKESSILKQSFSEIQKNVQQNHLITQLDKAENIIKVMEYDVSGNPKSYQVEQARAALLDAESLSLEEGTDNCFARLSNLKERLSKFEDSAAAASAAAAKMQSSARGDAEKVIEHINKLISDADGRLSGEEKNREAVNGIPLNQTHMGEVQSILDEISEKILKELNGGDLRDERERLQRMRSSLLGRLKKLQGGGASSGQSTAASAQPVSGNQDHTEVDNIRKALDVAEAPIEALTSNPNSSAKDDLITRARSHLEKATQMLGRLTDDALRPLRTELSTRLGHLNKQLSLIESGGGQVTPAEPQSEVLLQKGVAAFKKEMDEFGKKGTVSNAGFAVATGNMSALLSKFASSHASSGESARQTVPSSHNVLQPAVPHPPVRQNTLLHTGPVMSRPVLANGDSLASFASALNFTNTIIFDDKYTSIASLGIKPSSEKIKSLVTSTDISYKSLPFDVQERMLEAYNCGNSLPDKIKLVQVYAFAPDESDFNGASFQVRLDSIMPEHHRQKYIHSDVAYKYRPLGANLRMPEGLKKGNPFYEARWSLNENLDIENTVSFAHGSGGDIYSNLEDIGFTLVAPVLKALGASAEEATSAEAGFGIPFGIDLRKQPQSVLNELQRHRTQRYFGFEVLPDVTDSVVPDGGALDSDVVSDSESFGSSGINPLALHTKSTHGISSRKMAASEIFAKEVGILWVKTITDLPDVNSPYSLIDWVERNKPESENLRLPQLL